MTSTIARIAPTFTLGQRVTIFGSFGTPDVDGVVVKLPRPGGLLADPFVTVEADGMGPVRPVDPRRVAPASACDTCGLGGGCDCRMDDPAAGCAHYGCWGPQATNDCHTGAYVERARQAAYRFAQQG